MALAKPMALPEKSRATALQRESRPTPHGNKNCLNLMILRLKAMEPVARFAE